MTEDEMVGWQHQLNGHEFEQAPGDGEGQGSLACCSPWVHKELEMTERMNNITRGKETIPFLGELYGNNAWGKKNEVINGCPVSDLRILILVFVFICILGS